MTRLPNALPGAVALNPRWHWAIALFIGFLALSTVSLAESPRATVETRPDPLVSVADGRRIAPDIARIVARGELVVAMANMDTPPFFYLRDGRLVGLEVEMARDLARELQVAVRFNRQAGSFNEVIDLVARQEADVGISKLSRTLARAQQVRFSEPYLRLKHALAFNRLALAQLAMDSPVQRVVRDFGGTLGVIADSSFADFAAHHFPQANIQTYPDWPEAVRAVRTGEIIGVYRDEFEIKRLLKSDPTASLTLRTVTLTDLEDTLSIAVGVDDPVLLDVVNLFLAQRVNKLDIDKVLHADTHLR
ncbi:ABC transporter substrate-binding protein [Thiocystis violascens]|uniref:Amino acid ABC transporter substrate-binding protein, PAAT family n=1 Tax=Thiocystis violascens (strain ATCC 17096 / DSM 198 / 6111) TaxID=765911 RepID=I3YFZ8_THIV6|nr:ABC transporter substrate-binding protein [Thiocystis violascens]AFL75916.1 amino acid ABC transporter substrate-binding protein, PAAT family [Thiocystis violascens DSM 198]